MVNYPSCEQRINLELEETIRVLRDLWDLHQSDPDAYHEEHETNLYEYGLGFGFVDLGTFDDQTEAYYRYQLSWGGPSDEFRFFVDYDGKPYRIEYWFLDWFDGAHRILRGEDRKLLEEILWWFSGMGMCESHRA